MKAQAGEITPIGLIIAGIVFLGAGLSEPNIPHIGIIDFIGLALLILGIIGFAVEARR